MPGGHPAGDRGTVGEVLLLTLLNRQILGQEVIVCKGPFTNDIISEGKGDRQILPLLSKHYHLPVSIVYIS